MYENYIFERGLVFFKCHGWHLQPFVPELPRVSHLLLLLDFENIWV